MTSSMLRRRGFSLAVMAAAIFWVASPSAHPLATTTVSIAAARGSIDVTVIADADPLIAKLEALSPAVIVATSALSKAARLDALRQVLLDRLQIRVDDSPILLAWNSSAVDAASTATIHLSGHYPESARVLTWQASFIYGSYPVAFHLPSVDGESIQWLQAGETSAPVGLVERTSFVRTVGRALQLGVTHIIPNGFDHILFVLGLFFLSTRTKQVLLQVTAFTVAHSITLGLTLYGVISLRASIVEPLIAISVAYVGIENLMTTELRWRRVALVFAFGLLHGMGFAEALANLHLQRAQFLTTLVSFNVGVEAGQLAVIALAALALVVATRSNMRWRRPIARVASAAIGVAGVVWTLQRLAA